MASKQFNPLADIASILGSFAQLLPKIPIIPPEEDLIVPPSSLPQDVLYAPKPTYFVDISDKLINSQMEAWQKEQAAKGLVVFKYE